MIYTIDEEQCKKQGLKLEEVLAILLVKTGVAIPDLFKELVKKEVFVLFNNEWLVTQRWADVVANILLDSDKDHLPEDVVEDLAVKLMDVFPKGKKDNTSQYWRGNKRDITLRLKKFFKLYGNTYSSEDILEAAKKYVAGFNGVYSYMRVLKYFIWKDERKQHEDGTVKVIETSELSNYLENAGQEEELSEDWTSTLR